MGQIRGHLEAIGGETYNFCGVLQSGGTCGDTVWVEYVHLFICHGEADSVIPHIFFVSSEGETGKEVPGWYLAAGRVRESSEGSTESVHVDIHQHAPSGGGTVRGPPAYI